MTGTHYRGPTSDEDLVKVVLVQLGKNTLLGNLLQLRIVGLSGQSGRSCLRNGRLRVGSLGHVGLVIIPVHIIFGEA
jgi:hypothetical protein